MKHLCYKELNPGWENITEQIELLIGEKVEWLSLADSINESSYSYQEVIYDYLLSKGEPSSVAKSGFRYDVFSRERILPDYPLFRNDGEYSWSTVIPYYVKNYNLRLPKEFEEHILKMCNIDNI